MGNKFEWLKDGVSKSSEYSFSADGTYSSTTSAATNGTWTVLDGKMFQFVNKYGHEYTLNFDDESR